MVSASRAHARVGREIGPRAPGAAPRQAAPVTSLGVSFGWIRIEAGPLSQWLVNALTPANLPVICVETRHMKALLTAQQISKTDRNDARGIAQMMRVGLFKPVQQEQARRIDIGCALESG